MGLPAGGFRLESAAGGALRKTALLVGIWGRSTLNSRLIEFGWVCRWRSRSLRLAVCCCSVEPEARSELRVVVPGRLIRGAWQTPEALRAIIARERIKTIVTLTAINHDDPKYVSQAKVVAETGVNWIFVPMRGSRRPSSRWPRPPTCWPIPTAAGLLPLRRRPSPDQPGPRGLPDPPRRLAGGRGLEGVAELPWARPGAPADQMIGH